MGEKQSPAARSHGAPWFETNQARVLLEQKAMEMRFPQFRLMRDNKEHKLLWRGTLDSNGGNHYEIALIYPDDFPHKPPDVYPVDPVITVWKDEETGRLKHQYNDGRLCLYYPGDRTFAQNTTAATVVAVAAAWFFSYERWLESGKTDWPGIEVD